MERYFLACVRVMAMLVLGSLLLTCDKNEGGGWYSRCSSDDDCNEDLECVDSRFGEDFCSKTCSSNDFCKDWFGPEAACEIGDYCFKYCDSNSDCPGDAECISSNACRVQ